VAVVHINALTRPLEPAFDPTLPKIPTIVYRDPLVEPATAEICWGARAQAGGSRVGGDMGGWVAHGEGCRGAEVPWAAVPWGMCGEREAMTSPPQIGCSARGLPWVGAVGVVLWAYGPSRPQADCGAVLCGHGQISHGDAAGYVHARTIGHGPHQRAAGSKRTGDPAPISPEDTGSRGHAIADELSTAVRIGD
jgi:hypothetical protein